jgi:hypothetical protein
MSDYSFMKSGQSSVKDPAKLSENEILNIECILNLFIENAVKNAAKYVQLCQRNGITKEDMCYGLRYEVFEFLKRPNIFENIEDIKKTLINEYENLENGDYENTDLENEDYENADSENGDYENEFIVPDSILNNFERIEDKYITNINKDFIEKYHNNYDTWDKWSPSTPIEEILKNAINKIN